MAVTVTPIRAGSTQSVFGVEATADADVAVVIPHGLGVIPEQVSIEMLTPAGWLSTPMRGVVDITNVNLVLSNAVGSGAAGDQIRVVVKAPHSLVQ